MTDDVTAAPNHPRFRFAKTPEERAASFLVTARDDAPSQFQEFGRKYWAFDVINRFGKVEWTHRVRDIAPGTPQPHLAAGAGAVATAPEIACLQCGIAPWQVKNRSDFAWYVRTGFASDTGCGRCDRIFRAAVEMVETWRPQPRQ